MGVTPREAALGAVCADANVDAVIAIFISPVIVDATAMARAICRSLQGSPKTTLVVFMSKAASAEGAAILRTAGLPVYLYPEEAATALAAMNRYRLLRDRPAGRIPSFKVDAAGAARALAALAANRRKRDDGSEGGLLGREGTDDLLRAYGFPLVPSRLARTAAEAIDFSHEIGYPVVLKAQSSRIVHKTDVGGVKLDLRNSDEVWAAFGELEHLRRRAPDLRIQVQKMVKGGRELILGMAHDAQFGPLLMLGLGGIYVEVMRDVAVRVHPLTDAGAREMIRSLRGYPLLAGVRGEPGVDLAVVEDALLRLSQMVAELDAIREIDINPFIVSSRREDSYVVDARVRVES